MEREVLKYIRQSIKTGFLVVDDGDGVKEKDGDGQKYRVKASAATGALVMASLAFPPTRR